MPRQLRYPAQRTIRLTQEGDDRLIKIAVKKGVHPNEQARTYIEDGIRGEDNEKDD